MLSSFSVNYVDIILLAVWLIAVIEGVVKGLIKQIFGILALILACYCSYRFSGFSAEKLFQWFGWEGDGVKIAAFAITFVVVLLGVSLLGHLLDRIARLALLGWINKLFGAVFGWVKWNLLLVIFVYILGLIDQLIPFLPKEEMDNSILFPVIEKIASALTPYLPFLGK